MVAYSFRPFFEAQIATWAKRQTIRAPRPRHARPGEALQLYVGMRTRHCRKILTPDPVCTRVSAIWMAISDRPGYPALFDVSVDRLLLSDNEIEQFARADGFAPARINGHAIDMDGKTARENMGAFWLANHGPGVFEGVLIEWRAQP